MAQSPSEGTTVDYLLVRRGFIRLALLMGSVGGVGVVAVVGLWVVSRRISWLSPVPTPEAWTFAVIIILITAGFVAYAYYGGLATKVQVTDWGVDVSFLGRTEAIGLSSFRGTVRWPDRNTVSSARRGFDMSGSWGMRNRINFDIKAPRGVRTMSVTPTMALAILSAPSTATWNLSAGLIEDLRRESSSSGNANLLRSTSGGEARGVASARPSTTISGTQGGPLQRPWPRVASLFSVTGGTWIVGTGVLFIYFTLKLTATHPELLETAADVAAGIAALGLGVWLWLHPEHHSLAGALIILAGVVSLFFPPVGGFFIGFFLVLIGGILGILWKPPVHA